MLSISQKLDLYGSISQNQEANRFNLVIQRIVEVGLPDNAPLNWLDDFRDLFQSWAYDENIYERFFTYVKDTLRSEHTAETLNSHQNLYWFLVQILKNPNVSIFFMELFPHLIQCNYFFKSTVMASLQCENAPVDLFDFDDINQALLSDEDFKRLFDSIMPIIHTVPEAWVTAILKANTREEKNRRQLLLELITHSPASHAFYEAISIEGPHFHPVLIEHLYGELQKPLSVFDRSMIHQLIFLNMRRYSAYAPLLLIHEPSAPFAEAPTFRISRWFSSWFLSGVSEEDLAYVQAPQTFRKSICDDLLEHYTNRHLKCEFLKCNNLN